jgi:hypothetical protein
MAGNQLCPCAELDWSQCDQTASHHPQCTTGELFVRVEDWGGNRRDIRLSDLDPPTQEQLNAIADRMLREIEAADPFWNVKPIGEPLVSDGKPVEIVHTSAFYIGKRDENEQGIIGYYQVPEWYRDYFLARQLGISPMEITDEIRAELPLVYDGGDIPWDGIRYWLKGKPE